MLSYLVLKSAFVDLWKLFSEDDDDDDEDEEDESRMLRDSGIMLVV